MDQSTEYTGTSRFALQDAVGLYFQSNDGFRYGLEPDSGGELWKRERGEASLFLADPIFGAGEFLFWYQAIEEVGTGNRMAHPVVDKVELVVAGIVDSERLIAATKALDSEGNYHDDIRLFLLNQCGEVLWASPDTPGRWDFRFVGYGGSVLVTHSLGVRSTQEFYWLHLDGYRLELISGVDGGPFMLGRDGVIYTFGCTEGVGEPTVQIRSFNPDGTRRWELEDVMICNAAVHYVLREDGVLYLLGSNGVNIDIMTIQTESPGLATTTIPMYGASDRGTRWQTP